MQRLYNYMAHNCKWYFCYSRWKFVLCVWMELETWFSNQQRAAPAITARRINCSGRITWNSFILILTCTLLCFTFLLDGWERKFNTKQTLDQKNIKFKFTNYDILLICQIILMSLINILTPQSVWMYCGSSKVYIVLYRLK